jgi:cysteine desulfurase / selenocysteine lyase
VNLGERIYLDNAATSWPKPEAVYRAVDRYQRELGAPAGRGAYREAAEVERIVADARRRIAGLIGAADPKRIIFTLNGTDSLNLALHGLLRPGDHVVTSVVEHNSVLRPLRFVEHTRGISVTRITCSADGIVDPDAIRQAIRSDTRLIALIQASNVTGAVQPIAEVGRLARQHGVLFLVDAAQSLGHVPIDVRDAGAHLLAAPGHKGLLGPLGTGLLYVAPDVESDLWPQRQGGTGTHSSEDRQPDTLPDKYESGNLNVLGLAGLTAGAAHIQERGVDEICRHEMELTDRLLAGLTEIRGVTLYGPRESNRRVGVVSLTIAGYDPREAAALLDSTYSIQTRAGLHCAPLMHAALGTAESGGTLRLSPGQFNTIEQIDTAIAAIGEIAASAG